MIRKPDFVDECYKDSDLSPLNKLTLVIPTYNRNFYLSRCLWYHAHFPFGQIIVADSSPKEKKSINRNTIKKISEIFKKDILYLEYNPENETYGGDIYRKWGDAIQHVHTEYSQISTDKSFVIPSICCNSITFLENNHDYVNSFGGGATFFKLKSNHHYIPDTTIISYDTQNSWERIDKYAKSKTLIDNLFSIYHSDTHKSIYKNLIKYNINDIRFGETALALQPFLIGKINCIQKIGRIVDRAQSSSGILKIFNPNESSSYRYPNLQTYTKKLNDEGMEKLLQCLLSLSPNYPNMGAEEEIIKNATLQIVNWWMCSNNKDTIVNRYKHLIWDNLPYGIKHNISSIFKIGSYANTIPIDERKKEIETISKIITEHLAEQNTDIIINLIQ